MKEIVIEELAKREAERYIANMNFQDQFNNQQFKDYAKDDFISGFKMGYNSSHQKLKDAFEELLTLSVLYGSDKKKWRIVAGLTDEG